jgi:hypothetical protein
MASVPRVKRPAGAVRRLNDAQAGADQVGRDHDHRKQPCPRRPRSRRKPRRSPRIERSRATTTGLLPAGAVGCIDKTASPAIPLEAANCGGLLAGNQVGVFLVRNFAASRLGQSDSGIAKDCKVRLEFLSDESSNAAAPPFDVALLDADLSVTAESLKRTSPARRRQQMGRHRQSCECRRGQPCRHGHRRGQLQRIQHSGRRLDLLQ